MKTPSSFEGAYKKIKPTFEELQKVVESKVKKLSLKYGGFIDSRIKSPESLYLKSEFKNCVDPFLLINDLYACTIVLPNILQIDELIFDIEQEFDVVEIKKRDISPEEFPYNDINIIAKVKQGSYNRRKLYLNYSFELQVKTLLQSAWGKANHDVVFKGRKRSWNLERINSEIRALLEMADTLIADLEKTSALPQISSNDDPYKLHNEIVRIILEVWDDESLPGDLRRMVGIIEKYLSYSDTTIFQLNDMINNTKYEKVLQMRSISPTQAIFTILFLERGDEIVKNISSQHVKVPITKELVLIFPELNSVPKEFWIEFNGKSCDS